MYLLIIAFFLVLQPVSYIFPAAAELKEEAACDAFYFGDLEEALGLITGADEEGADLDEAPTADALALLMRMAGESAAKRLPPLVIAMPLDSASPVLAVETPSPKADSPRAPRGKKKKGRILVRLDVKTLSKIKAAEERKEKLLAASSVARSARLAESRARRMGYAAAASKEDE